MKAKVLISFKYDEEDLTPILEFGKIIKDTNVNKAFDYFFGNGTNDIIDDIENFEEMFNSIRDFYYDLDYRINIPRLLENFIKYIESTVTFY